MQPVKISFCTVSRNRLAHIMETLPANIRSNEDYPELEFVLLDYNSTDGLEEWVRSSLSGYLESGRLKFFRTTLPTVFNRSHSSNMAFRLASGDIICRIDADNFTGDGFAHYIDRQFRQDRNIYLGTSTSVTYTTRDVIGRICLKKKDFETVGGYDEKMNGYGFEDIDLSNRLKVYGLSKEPIRPRAFLKAISHDDALRVSNEYIMQNKQQILLRHVSPSLSEVLILMTDQSCLKLEIINAAIAYADQPTLFTQLSANYCATNYKKWEYGTWSYDEDGHIIFSGEHSTEKLHPAYQPLTDQELTDHLIMVMSQSRSRHFMEANRHANAVALNEGSFGKGVVYLNSNYNFAIEI